MKTDGFIHDRYYFIFKQIISVKNVKDKKYINYFLI